ncbi:GbsR/MarR family transcriptional regulator [Mangrovibrevibacter kandeliae]|uniref:GbsR/MarR family transcriptional regulator n=1 Tax=Mangrovibrevibacter kandeliae TaxID=2968473 RepID=UPI0021174634|nr:MULTISPECIES: MarR family transcriptional regulator [unclassified Aurantimonas]MCQ8784092.1 MarR family transcriptional regulator [Aurantimonas sp. CSK15Z-1]MCW4116811.1 MarR family transcriptional regulator [Aurantimonas sp. MSK8Z-1]
MLDRSHDIEATFVEEMGILAQADDLPRIAGRIIGLLTLSEAPLSFGAIAERLRVSRGSVSTNTRLLIEAGMIEKAAMPGDRQDYFRLAADAHQMQLQRMVARLDRLRHAVATVAERSGTSATAHERLTRAAGFYADVSATIRALAEREAARPQDDQRPEISGRAARSDAAEAT